MHISIITENRWIPDFSCLINTNFLSFKTTNSDWCGWSPSSNDARRLRSKRKTSHTFVKRSSTFIQLDELTTALRIFGAFIFFPSFSKNVLIQMATHSFFSFLERLRHPTIISSVFLRYRRTTLLRTFTRYYFFSSPYNTTDVNLPLVAPEIRRRMTSHKTNSSLAIFRDIRVHSISN